MLCLGQSKSEKVGIARSTGIEKQVLLCRAPELFDYAATEQAQANI